MIFGFRDVFPSLGCLMKAEIFLKIGFIPNNFVIFGQGFVLVQFGSHRESRPVAETRRAEAMIFVVEEELIESWVLELERVAGSKQLKFVALR